MINDLKEFEKFLKICRKQGVTDVTFSGVSVKLGDAPAKQSVEVDETEVEAEPSDEALMFSHIRTVGEI